MGTALGGRLFRRDPIKHFSEYFKLAGLERILPLAFSRRDIGELVDRTVSEEELLGKLGVGSQPLCEATNCCDCF